MSVVFDKYESLQNLKRQSKRVSRLANLQLSKAQYLLAFYIYNEKSYSDVKAKINDRDFSGRLYLTALSQGASEALIRRFLQDRKQLVDSLNDSPLSAAYEGAVDEFIYKVFDIDKMDPQECN